METLVVRITPRRIERMIFILIVITLLYTTAYYADKYYDTTPVDEGYLDQIFSGTFLTDIPTETEIAVGLEDNSAKENNKTETVNESAKATTETQNTTTDNETEEPEPECTEDSDCDNSKICEEEVCVAPPAPEKCTEDDMKLVSFVTDDTGSGSKEGTVNKTKISFCNTDDDEHRMIVEVYIWDQMAIDEGYDETRKATPRYTTPMTMSLQPGESYVKTYKLDHAISIFEDDKFHYIIKFFNVDADGEKLDTEPIKTETSTATI